MGMTRAPGSGSGNSSQQGPDLVSRFLNIALELARRRDAGTPLDTDEQAIVELGEDIGGVAGIAADERAVFDDPGIDRRPHVI